MSNKEQHEKAKAFFNTAMNIHVWVNGFYNDVVNVDITVEDVSSAHGSDRAVAKIESFEAIFDQDDFAVQLDKPTITGNQAFFLEVSDAYLKATGETMHEEYGDTEGYPVDPHFHRIRMPLKAVVDTIEEKLNSAALTFLIERLEKVNAVNKVHENTSLDVEYSLLDPSEINDGSDAGTPGVYTYTPQVALNGGRSDGWIDIGTRSLLDIEGRLVRSDDLVGLGGNETLVKAVENAFYKQDVRFRAYDRDAMKGFVDEFIGEKVAPRLKEGLYEVSNNLTLAIEAGPSQCLVAEDDLGMSP